MIGPNLGGCESVHFSKRLVHLTVIQWSKARSFAAAYAWDECHWRRKCRFWRCRPVPQVFLINFDLSQEASGLAVVPALGDKAEAAHAKSYERHLTCRSCSPSSSSEVFQLHADLADLRIRDHCITPSPGQSWRAPWLP
jgi:hypothetical protein